MKSFQLVLFVTLLTAIVVLSTARPAPSAPPPATAETLKQLEGEFMKAALEKGSRGYMSYYAEDAVELPNNSPSIHGKTNIAETMSFLDDKNNRLTWKPVGADISASGDLGYTYGTYEFESPGQDGAQTEYGKYTSIWKLQKDGSWKVVSTWGTPARCQNESETLPAPKHQTALAPIACINEGRETRAQSGTQLFLRRLPAVHRGLLLADLCSHLESMGYGQNHKVLAGHCES